MSIFDDCRLKFVFYPSILAVSNCKVKFMHSVVRSVFTNPSRVFEIILISCARSYSKYTKSRLKKIIVRELLR